MKAILISDHAKWCALMMNGEKTIEVRKNKALATAIQKLIDEYGYADIYVYCSKDDDLGCIKKLSKDKYVCGREFDINDFNYLSSGYNGKGKVIFKFRCYKVEEISTWFESDSGDTLFYTDSLVDYELEKKSCLSLTELQNYFAKSLDEDKEKVGYAIHISNLEIFDKPKELSEFNYWNVVKNNKYIYGEFPLKTALTKAPQNFCYVEVE